MIADPEYLAQAEVQDLADKVVKAADTLGQNGIATYEITPQKLILYWNGELPASIRKITSESGIEVELRQSAYSRRVLLAAIEKFTDNLPSAVEEAGFVSAAPSRDRNSIDIVTINPMEQSDGALLSEFDGIPMNFRSGGTRAKFISGPRNAHTRPFWGGAYVYRTLGQPVESCSTGWSAATIGTSLNGILTARHCGTARWYTNGTDEYIGQDNIIFDKRDAMFLVGGNSYRGVVLVGGWNNATSRKVDDWGWPGLNTRVVTSGGLSGGFWHRVVQADIYFDTEDIFTPGHETVGPGFLSRDDNSPRRLSVGQGDSGAPVFTYDAAKPTTHVNARGLLSAAVNVGVHPRFECEGPDWADYRFCSTEAFSINVGDILSSLGLRLLTETPRLRASLSHSRVGVGSRRTV